MKNSSLKRFHYVNEKTEDLTYRLKNQVELNCRLKRSVQDTEYYRILSHIKASELKTSESNH